MKNFGKNRVFLLLCQMTISFFSFSPLIGVVFLLLQNFFFYKSTSFSSLCVTMFSK